MGEDGADQPEQPFGRYGPEYRLTLLAAGSAVGILAFGATRSLPPWSGLGPIAAFLVSGWSILLFLHARAAFARQRRIEGLRRAREFAERLVIYDSETHFYADWYFRLLLQEELMRSQRFGHSCALVLAESTRGRLSRERERALFHAMATTFRGTDLVAHLGSLRFAVLMPNTGAEGAGIARARLLGKLPASEIEAGLATYPDDGKDWRELLTAAGASSTDFYGSAPPVWSPESASRFIPRAHEPPLQPVASSD